MSQIATSIADREKAAQLKWTVFILMFFMIQAVIWTVAISITANDASHAVVAGYDQKALSWDEEKATQLASTRLGWNSVLTIDHQADIMGFRELKLTLKDATEVPLTEVAVELVAFHRARASKPQSIRLTEIEPGVYAGKVQVRKAGLWQLTGTARRGSDTFLIDRQQHLAKGG